MIDFLIRLGIVYLLMLPIYIAYIKFNISKDKRQIDDVSRRIAAIDEHVHAEKPNVTKKYIDFVREICVDYTTVAFNQFIRVTNIDKSNRHIIEKFIGETSTEIHEYLKLDDNSKYYSELLVSESYINRVIVDSVIFVTTQMLEKHIDETSPEITIQS